MRAGSPWKATRSPARWIQRARPSSSGNSSSTARSVAAMSAGSPDRATQRNGPLPSQNKRPDVGGQEARVGERPVEAAQLGLGAQAVAVVEDLGALVHEPDHRRAVPGDRLAGATHVAVRIGAGHLGRRFGREVHRDVGQRVVGAGLVGDDVGGEVEVEEPGDVLGGVADEPDGAGDAAVAGGEAAGDGVLDVGGHLVEVAGLDAPLDAMRVDVDAQRDTVVHRDRQRLGAAHPAEASGQRDRAGQ